jgi:hypothetical protein
MTLRSRLLPLVVLCGLAGLAQAQGGTVYRCPGNSFTNSITAKEADAKGCKPVEGGNVTVVSTPKRTGAAAPAAAGNTQNRVDPADQKARDSDARRILETELRKAEEQLASLQKEYNNGEPERRGDEKNFQKYIDRTAELKASIARTEADIAAIKRELAKLP